MKRAYVCTEDATSTVYIKGGKFGFNPSKWIPATHKAEKSGNVWIVSEI
jgi:hypothetical protein